MGTPRFAALVLADFHQYENIIAVITQPDAMSGRNKKIQSSPVKKMAQEFSIPVLTPATLRKSETINMFKELSPDAIVVAAYGNILPPEILSLPRLGCLNVHASLLPRWRGAAPIERAILAGDRTIGTSIMMMEKGLDTGQYCCQRTIEIGDANIEKITEQLAYGIGIELHSVLDLLDNNPDKICWTAQDEQFVTYAEKLSKRDLYIDDEDDAQTIVRKIQASSGSKPCKVKIAGKSLTILSARLFEECEIKTGKARLHQKKLLLGTKHGTVELVEVKPDGKKTMKAQAFAAGVPALKDGDKWGSV